MGTFAETARANATLYNNCKDNKEPDWSEYDGIEINACASDDGATETVPLHEAEFFTVYGHLKEGGCMALTDVSTRKLATEIAHHFLAKLGEGATFFDCCWKSEEPQPQGRDAQEIAAQAQRDAAYISSARQKMIAGDDIEIDDEPELSHGEGGCWVAAWVWVADEDTD